MTDKTTRLLLFLSLLFLSACAHEETKPSEKNYSASTQKEFGQIERGEVKRSSIPPAHDLQKRTVKRPAVTTKEPVEMNPSEQVSPKAQERLQEINQNLAFYCMKHRKEFSSEQSCLKFTQTVLNACEKKHKLINTVMVNCIKVRLKKRR